MGQRIFMRFMAISRLQWKWSLERLTDDFQIGLWRTFKSGESFIAVNSLRRGPMLERVAP